MRLFPLIAAFLLGGCSAEHVEALRQQQEADLGREVHGLVHDGMPAAQAVSALQQAGFACSASTNAAPNFDCGRQRTLGWTIVSCLQRVTFTDTPADAARIERLEVSGRACIGTP